MENPQKILNEMKLSQSFLDDDKNISFKYFYSKIVPLFTKNSNQSNELNINFNIKNNINNIIYNIKLVKINKIYFEITLFKNNKWVKKLEKVFIESIKIKFNQENLEIVNLDQFNQIRGIIQLKNPFLRCCFHEEIMNYSIKHLIIHRLKKDNPGMCNFKIFENNDDVKEYYSAKKFFNLFNNINKNKNVFESPLDFEINYENYFEYYNYQKLDKEFIFLDDNNSSRELSIDNLTCYNNYLGSFTIYFGLEGIGKSITLIKAFKYNYNHNEFGILYIHCKCMKELYYEDYKKLKKILNDEIIYLFKNEYEKYKECSNFIDNFENKNNNFFDLIISIILNFCINKSKKYLFIFDQYNTEFDINEELKKLNKKLIRNSKKYGLIACCSMDNKSVRELKIKYLSVELFNEKVMNEDADNIIIQEVNQLFDLSNLTIDKGGLYDKTWTKIGKTIKNYIVLKDYYKNKDDFGMKNNYVWNLKGKVAENLKSFFNLNKKIIENNDNSILMNLQKVLSFTVDTDYKIDYLKKIKNLIPFKYFDIKKNDIYNTAKITFNFELVGEVINKIYEDIICENENIYQLFDNIGLDQGALSELYKKFVIHFMEPKKYEKKKRVFNHFDIIGTMTVEKFVPESNEKYFENDFKIKKLKEGDYLFKQRQFGEKAVDCAIISIKNNGHAEVFFFQISINKAVLYTIERLKEIIDQFIEYFGYQFEFIINREDVYFTYIFHTKDKNELNKKCDKNGLRCIFFNPSVQHFISNNYDLDDEKTLININNIFVKPFKSNNPDDDIDMEEPNIKGTLNNYMKPCYMLSDKEKKSIENFLKDMLIKSEESDIEISFSHNEHYYNEEKFNEQNIYLRQLKSMEIDDWISYSLKNKVEKEIYKKKSFVLLIYKGINLQFRLITNDGEILELKSIPIGIQIGIKNYDVYNINICK